MRSRFCFPILFTTVLMLAGQYRERVHAGSFLGPCCYGARYTSRYPNRSHNNFGNYPCCPCPAWHPFFRPGLYVRKPNALVGGMPMNGTTIIEMPADAARIAPMQAPQPSGKPPF